jgi:hypothetical protein
MGFGPIPLDHGRHPRLEPTWDKHVENARGARRIVLEIVHHARWNPQKRAGRRIDALST